MTAEQSPLDNVCDLIVDRMGDELNNWQLIGPLAHGDGQCFYKCVRVAAASMRGSSVAADEEAKAECENFTSKEYATAFLQWRAVKAALEDEAIRRSIASLDA